MLQCNVRKCQSSDKYPLLIEPIDSGSEIIPYETVETEYAPEFLERLLPKLDWTAFENTLVRLKWFPLLARPPTLADNAEAPSEPQEHEQPDHVPFYTTANKNELNERWWRLFHEYLLERKFMEAKMVCRACHHVYPIKEGIPNMLIREDEI